MLKEYIAGSVASLIQTITVYPLDTLKTYSQSRRTIPIKFFNLYRGIKYPLVFDSCIGSLMFGTYYNLKKNNYSNESSSIITGLLVGLSVSPFEVYKIKNQLNISKNINIFRGIHFTISREIIGNYIYFGSYRYLKKELKLPTYVCGGLCGSIMWTFVYPIDNLKTNYIINEFYIKDYLKKNYKNLFNGYKFCLLRAIPANIIVFQVYEIIINLL